MRWPAIAVLLLGACGKEAPPATPPIHVDDSDFPRMGPPRPGDWLDRFDEPGQTFEAYAGGAVNRKSEERAVIFIRPLGDVLKTHRGTIEAMRAYAEVFYQTEARLLDPRPLPAEALHAGRRQYGGDRLLEILADERPERTLMYVGLMSEDLYSGDLNFVFGVGSVQDRVGVYSLHRLGGEEFLRRALKIMSHEMGHILSIQHCTAYQCVMNGSNSLGETDRQPMYLCPQDLRKVVWNTGCSVRKRYDDLETFYLAHDLKPEAAFVAKVKLK
jgi:archaemetzincin